LIIEVDSIALSFDNKKILYGVYLRAETGKITGILGRNGCGKTCLLRIIFGDLNAKYKNIRINSIHQKKELYKTNSIAYLPQHQLLPKNLKLSKVFALFNIKWDDFTEIFDAFTKYKDTRVNMLSSGELRVVETYLILSSKKDIILLDEPFSFIAPIYIEKIKFLMEEKKKHCIILVTDHFYRDILDISDSIYFLKNGYSKIIKTKEDLENEGYVNVG